VRRIVVDHGYQLIGATSGDQPNWLGKLDSAGGDIGQVGASGSGNDARTEPDDDQA
jgi:hypothetical protein